MERHARKIINNEGTRIIKFHFVRVISLRISYSTSLTLRFVLSLVNTPLITIHYLRLEAEHPFGKGANFNKKKCIIKKSLEERYMKKLTSVKK